MATEKENKIGESTNGASCYKRCCMKLEYSLKNVPFPSFFP